MQQIESQKKELETKFTLFQETHNKQKGELHLVIAKLKKQYAALQQEMEHKEKKIAQQNEQITDLLEDRKRK